MWVIRSWFEQIALKRRDTLLSPFLGSRANRSLQKRDGSDSLFFRRESLFRSLKTSDSLEKLTSEFPTLPLSFLFALVYKNVSNVLWFLHDIKLLCWIKIPVMRTSEIERSSSFLPVRIGKSLGGKKSSSLLHKEMFN